MRIHRNLFLAIVTATALSAACLLADDPANQPKPNQQPQAQQPRAQQEAPEGFVLVDERVITLTVNEPENHFIRAHELLEHGNRRAAAAEARIGAAYLDLQAARHQGGESAKQLTAAAENVRKVADEIRHRGGQQGSAKPAEPQKNPQEPQQKTAQADTAADRELRAAFAQADHALADSFRMHAEHNLQKHRALMAGYDLDASATALRAAIVWTDQKPAPEVQTAIADAHQSAERLLTPNEQGNRRESGQQGRDINKENVKKESANKETANKENTNKENVNKETANKENTNKETANKESTAQKESAEDRAEPAAARISGSRANQPAEARDQEIQDAQKAVQELNKAIQETAKQCCNEQGNTNTATPK